LVYIRPDATGIMCGLAFFRSLNAWNDDAREKAIWRFLLAEQARAIRDSHAQASGASQV
jgi:hypothetical protein